MAQDIVLTVQTRAARGRRDMSKLRSEGVLPGVIYGAGIEPLALSVPKHELLRALHAHGEHPLVTIKVEGGEEYLALVKDLQIDHVKQLALHVDFHRVQEDVAVATSVEIVYTGTPEGVKLGGILEAIMRSVEIEALPRALPENIQFDVSAMNIGDSAHISDLVAPPGVTILTDVEQTMVAVAAPRTEEAAQLSAEDAEALAALSPEELEALQELAAAAAPAEGEAAADESGGDEAPEAGGDAEA